MFSDENDVRRAVCFSPQKRKYLNKLSEKKQGVTIKKVKLEVGRDIILKDEATIHESVVNFQPADETFVESTIMQVLYEYQLYARIHVRGTVVKLSDVEHTSNGALKLQKFVNGPR